MRTLLFFACSLSISLCGVDQVGAGILHASASAYYDSVASSGDTFAHADYSNTYYGFASATAQASSIALLRSYSDASGDGSHGGVNTDAVATWTDILTIAVPNAADLPSSLRIGIASPGSIHWSLSYPLGQAMQAEFAITTQSPGVNNEWSFLEQVNDNADGTQTTQERSIGNWDSFSFLGNGYSAGPNVSSTMHFDVPIHADPTNPLVGHSDTFNVQLLTLAQTDFTALSPLGFGISDTVDFGHSLALTYVDLPNGLTPESQGFSLSFDSGLASPNGMAAVPEPTSLTLFSICTACLFFAMLRRKMSLP